MLCPGDSPAQSGEKEEKVWVSSADQTSVSFGATHDVQAGVGVGPGTKPGGLGRHRPGQLGRQSS